MSGEIAVRAYVTEASEDKLAPHVLALGGAVGVNLLAVLLDWRLSVYGAAGEPALAFRDCFLVVTIAFAAAVIPAWSIRKHSLG